MRQLGRAVSIIAKFERECHELHADVDAFHAPSECHDVVSKGNARRLRVVKRHACHVAGVKNLQQLRREVKKVVPHWDRYNHFRLGLENL